MAKEPPSILDALVRERRKENLKETLLSLFSAVVAEAILSVPMMFAWNCVVPLLTKLPALGYWQSFSLLFLLGLLKNVLWPAKSS